VPATASAPRGAAPHPLARYGGLSEAEAARRRQCDGPNEVPRPPGRPAWRQLADQLGHFFARMLWVAAGLAAVAGLPQLAVAIVVVVLVNGGFAFAQERGAERAADRLRALLPQQVTVVRDGAPRRVAAADLVVGDVVLLEGGDRVPADLVLEDATALAVDLALLTGESVPERPDAGAVLPAGVIVVEGEAVGTATATGARTRLAGITALTAATRPPPSPLARELHQLVRAVAGIALAVGLVFLAVSLVRGLPVASALVFAIGVTVALVPEALLPTVTLSLAVGAQRMAHRHALVRSLEAVETLGAVTYVCTDKTGTLTRNEQQVVAVWTPAGTVRIEGEGYRPDAAVTADDLAGRAAARTVAAVARGCSTGRAVRDGDRWVAFGDPLEAAVDALVTRLGPAAAMSAAARTTSGEIVARFPFDPRRRRVSVVRGGAVLVKGAPEAVLPRCGDASAVVPGTAPDTVPDTAPDTAAGTMTQTAAAEAAEERLAAAGLRTLAVAWRPVGDRVPTSADEAETGLELLGLLAFLDPARPQVRPAIRACRTAGIRVAVVTGDHPATAVAVAEQVGLLDAGRLVIVGADLPSDDAALGELLDRDGVVVARVSPEDKLRVARALQARGHVVAMTGDGVNDAPALREADVGVAMGRGGSDAAREAADLVLLDDDFATIVAAVEQGRATFANMRRFLTYHLTDNVAELAPLVVWVLSGGTVPLALGVLQILALDLATDTLSAVALGSEPSRRHVLRRPPVSGRLLHRLVAWRAFGLLGPLEVVGGMAGFLAVLWAGGWRPGAATPAGLLAAASGTYFLVVVAAQSANAFACRSTRWPPWHLGWGTNRLLVGAVLVEGAAAAALLLVPPLAAALGHAAPPALGWAAAIAATVLLLVGDAIDKRRRRGRPRG
jgi:magnesium-transporting ATPase (P-type)